MREYSFSADAPVKLACFFLYSGPFGRSEIANSSEQLFFLLLLDSAFSFLQFTTLVVVLCTPRINLPAVAIPQGVDSRVAGGLMKISIIGSGFAALTSVRELRKQSPDAEITLISPTAEFIYLPSLIWIPSGLRSPDDLKTDLTRFFRRMSVTHLSATVTGISDNGRTVFTDVGPVANDGLIIASGGCFIKNLPGIEHTITPCGGIDAVVAIRDRLHSMTEGTIAIGFSGNPDEIAGVRGGPMFEILFGIDAVLRKQQRRNKFNLIFFSLAEEPPTRSGSDVPRSVFDVMKERNIRTHLGHKITGFESQRVCTEGGDIEADMILFTPGMTGPSWAEGSPVTRSVGGFIKADEFCRVEGMEKTYVAGDSGSYPGPDWQAKQAHSADLQAVAASRNLLSELNGNAGQETFKHELVCILDTLTHGIFVKRAEDKSVTLPPLKLMHYAKRFFEFWYLRKYR